MEKIASIFGLAGIGCFLLAGIVTGYLPVAHLSRLEYSTLEEITPKPTLDFLDLAKRYPDQFKKYYGEPNVESFRKALVRGRDVYIAEACWHCHSQFVRPVSNEEHRFGKVSWAKEYINEMNLPHLFGTRRIGPDLIRQSGKHGNDWHVAHFYDSSLVSPTSVMPRYTWFYDGEKPNDRGIAIITYVQWLGSWATPEVLTAQAEAEAAAKEGDDG